MTEIPEHLLKRAAEAKAKAAAKAGGDAPVEEAAPATEADAGATADVTPQAAADPSGKIPAHLLARSAAAKAKAAGGGGGGGGDDAGAAGGGGGGGVAAPARPDAGTPAATGAAGPRVTGLSSPEGHTQRLLTVVKAGSIQDVKMTPTDKVHVWPHLLAAEFLASLSMTAFMLVFSVFVNAPLLGLRNYNQTPNPSKAPWYFLGLQELLTMFHPMVAGVTIPGMGIFLLILAPYIDRNPSNKPEDRKFAITMMVIFLMFWAVLVIIGSFFRGPGFNFILPWRQGVHEIFDL